MAISRRQLNKLLCDDAVIVNLIKSAAIYERLLDILVTHYFVVKHKSEKEAIFQELVVDQLSYSRKISILRRAKYSRRHKSLEALDTLEDLGFLRNFVAHRSGWQLSDSEFRRLSSKSRALDLLQNYPRDLDRALDIALERIGRLNRSKDFSKHAYDETA